MPEILLNPYTLILSNCLSLCISLMYKKIQRKRKEQMGGGGKETQSFESF